IQANVDICHQVSCRDVFMYRRHTKKYKPPLIYLLLPEKSIHSPNRSTSNVPSMYMQHPLLSDKTKFGSLYHAMWDNFTNARKQQLQELSDNSSIDNISEIERYLNRDLTIASFSLALSLIGALFYTSMGVLSIPGLLWVAGISFKDAYKAVKLGNRPEMHLLNGIFFVGGVLTGNYFAAALGSWFSRLSRKMLLKTEDQSRKSMINVFGRQQSSAWLVTNDVEIETPIESLNQGDTIVVHAGETIPVDGMITHGTAHIDQHILTGESQPVEKERGDDVFASTVVLSGKIFIEVQRAGEDTVAAQIGDILNQTADYKDAIESWGETIGHNSALITMIGSALIWPLVGTVTALAILNTSIGFYISVLGPLSMLSYLNLASYQRILVKDGRSLQLLTQIDTVVFDKTGTLTLEQPHVGAIYTALGVSKTELLTCAAAAEYKQTHPVAKAILEEAFVQSIDVPQPHEVRYEIGYGLEVSIPAFNQARETDDDWIHIGSARFMEMVGIQIEYGIQQRAEHSRQHGHSFVYVARNQQLIGAIELHVSVRPETQRIIDELKKRHIELYIISGDQEQPTKKLAQELGIPHYFAETLPENKAKIIDQLQTEGKSVCFVGDGINDSIALKKAKVSISLRGASSAATDAAQIILMEQDLTQLIQALDVSQQYANNMKLNVAITILPGLITIYGVFFWGFGMAHSVIMNDVGAVIGVSNAVWPWLKERRKRLFG
ncbi:MAG: heavy metal translocating P-type ATPase, partial [Chloroflexota bacterium]